MRIFIDFQKAKEGLTPRKVFVSRNGRSFQQTVYIKTDRFSDEVKQLMKPEEKKLFETLGIHKDPDAMLTMIAQDRLKNAVSSGKFSLARQYLSKFMDLMKRRPKAKSRQFMEKMALTLGVTE